MTDFVARAEKADRLERTVRDIVEMYAQGGHDGHHNFPCNDCQKVDMIRKALDVEPVGDICGSPSPPGSLHCDRETGHAGSHQHGDGTTWPPDRSLFGPFTPCGSSVEIQDSIVIDTAGRSHRGHRIRVRSGTHASGHPPRQRGGHRQRGESPARADQGSRPWKAEEGPGETHASRVIGTWTGRETVPIRGRRRDPSCRHSDVSGVWPCPSPPLGSGSRSVLVPPTSCVGDPP